MNTTRIALSLDNQSRYHLETLAKMHNLTKNDVVKILLADPKNAINKFNK